MSETTNAQERLFDALSAGVRGHALGPYLDEVEFAAIRLATPPTPDLDAVVARVREAAEGMELMQVEKYTRLAADLRALLAAVSRPAESVAQDGGSSVPTPEDLAFRRGVYAERAEWRKATGAAHWSEVSRPAEARGEPVAWGLRDKTTGRINAARGQRANAERVAVDLLTHSIEVDIVPLYTHPAPSGGEGVKPEMVKVALDEADRDLREGETFASVLAASLNRQMAAPRPEPGEPSESVTDADIAEWAERHGININASDLRPAFEDARTLSAQREQTP